MCNEPMIQYRYMYCYDFTISICVGVVIPTGKSLRCKVCMMSFSLYATHIKAKL